MKIEGNVPVEVVGQPFVIHYQHTKANAPISNAHMHEHIEILYCTNGSYEIWLNGVYYRFEKGDMVIINSHEVHRIHSASNEEGGYICARFLPEMIYTSTAAAFDMQYVMPFILNNSKHQRIFTKKRNRKYQYS